MKVLASSSLKVDNSPVPCRARKAAVLRLRQQRSLADSSEAHGSPAGLSGWRAIHQGVFIIVPFRNSKLERRETSARLLLFSSHRVYFFTAPSMYRSKHVLVISKITPAGILDIPEQAWVPLANFVRERFGVSLKVYDHPPDAETGVEFAPGRNLFVELAGDTREAVDLAFRAIHGHIDHFIERYTKTNTNEVAAEHQ